MTQLSLRQRRLCTATDCRANGQHQPTCPGTDCHGCAPRPNCVICGKRAAEHGQVCDTSRIRLDAQLRTIAELYALLPAALDASTVHAIVDLTLPARAEPVTDTRIPLYRPVPVDVHVRRTEYPAGVPAIVDEWLSLRELRPVYDEAGEPVLQPAGDQVGGIPVASVLLSWVRDWAEERGDELPASDDVDTLVAWLRDRERFRWVCVYHPAVREFAGEVRMLLRWLRLALHRDLSPVRYQAPCPYCQIKSLRRGPGADWIECVGATVREEVGGAPVRRWESGCGRLWGEDEYGLLARAAIHADELLDTAEAAIIAQVRPNTISQWKSRGHLVPVEYDEGGRPWYRRADVDAARDRVAV